MGKIRRESGETSVFRRKPWRRGDSLAPSKWNQKGSRKVGRLYGKIRRESGETSVFRRKTLAQGRFTRPEQVESKGLPQSRETLWDY